MSRLLICLSIFFLLGKITSLPLQNYTVYGYNFNSGSIKSSLDVTNQRYANILTICNSGVCFYAQTVVYPISIYQQYILADGSCSCTHTNQGYSDLINYWDNFQLESIVGNVSKYTGLMPNSFPYNQNATLYNMTEYLSNTLDYPLNISYTDNILFVDQTYSSKVDETTFTTKCCVLSSTLNSGGYSFNIISNIFMIMLIFILF